MPRVHRFFCSALAAVGAAAPLPATADRFQFAWHYKWSVGWVQHAGGVADSDPSPFRAVYEGSLLDFALQAHAPGEALVLSGSGGDFIVEDQPLGQVGCGAAGAPACVGQRFTFEFGAVRPGDAARYRMTATAPFRAPGEPGWPLNPFGEWKVGHPDDGGGLWGVVTNDLDDREYGTMSAYFGTAHTRLATPVPEPGTLALLALGLLGVGARAGRRVV